MAKKATKTTSSPLTESAAAAAPARATAPRAKKHVKAQAAGVVAAVEGFVSSMVHSEPTVDHIDTAVIADFAPLPVAEKRVTHEAIAKRAFEFYMDRQGMNGNAADDWFRAEQALKHA